MLARIRIATLILELSITLNKLITNFPAYMQLLALCTNFPNYENYKLLVYCAEDYDSLAFDIF